jgi:HAD superfamily hydrolase (TIGR01544 family)
MATQFNSKNPAGFYVHNLAYVQQKLDNFARAGAKQISYVLDFDRTLTTSKHTGEDITTWYILHGVLPDMGQQEMNKLHDKFQPMEVAGDLTENDALTWWNSALDLYVKHPVNISDISKAATRVQLRDGTTQLFRDCENVGVPTVILSAGVSDVIDIIVSARGINPTLVLSTKLVLAEDGHILGWDRGSMIHVLNKREQGNNELSRIRDARPYTILVGDSLQDVDMVEGAEDVLRIRMCDLKHPNRATRQKYLKQSFEAGFDMVLEEDLEPLVRLNQWLITQ